jgi:hypothetical protein
MHKLLWSAALLLLLPASPTLAQAQPAPPTALEIDPRLSEVASRLPALLAEGADLATAFSPEFFADVPLAQVQQVFASLRAQHGIPQTAGPLIPGTSRGNGVVTVGYERADITLALAVDASGRIAGLRITDVATRGDTLDRIGAELATLPGTVGWGIYRLDGNGRPIRIAGAGEGEHLAVGSGFKLAVLGALDEEIASGRMHWSDTIVLDQVSVPSGMMQDWPRGTPITLQAAAQLMIAISDNTATDLLIRHVGRERIEAFARRQGGLSGPNAFPLLTTIEASVLKNPALGIARTAWLAGGEAERRAVLERHASLFVPANVDFGAYARPADILDIEWFASAESMARLLGWYATRASDTARAIIAVNAGLPSGNARQWAYVGYKGGSEPGVIALNLLLRSHDGSTYAVVMSWNNPEASVDDSRLSGLAARAAAILRQPAAR